MSAVLDLQAVIYQREMKGVQKGSRDKQHGIGAVNINTGALGALLYSQALMCSDRL